MTESKDKRVEEIAEQIHHVYCAYYKARHGKEYWTEGDYSQLDEATKDADRYMAKFCLTLIEDAEREARIDEVKRFQKAIFPAANGRVIAEQRRKELTNIKVLDKINSRSIMTIT